MSQNPDNQKPAAGTDPRATEPASESNKRPAPGASSAAKGGDDAEIQKRAKAHAERTQNDDG